MVTRATKQVHLWLIVLLTINSDKLAEGLPLLNREASFETIARSAPTATCSYEVAKITSKKI